MSDTMVGMSIAEYAGQMLSAFDTPIATDRVEALIYMMVGAGRTQLLADLSQRSRDFLKPDQPGAAPRGMLFEAVLGEFGAGKSHVGYLFKHNAQTMGAEVLVAHVQITGEARFNAALSAILRNLRLGGQPSVSAYGVEVSAYRQMFRWVGSSMQKLAELCQTCLGNLPQQAAQDFALAVADAARPEPTAASLQRFIDGWIARTEPKVALEAFELIMRTFARLKVGRLVMIIDEFEAMQSLDEGSRMQVLQAFQDMHDDFAGRMPGLPATHLVVFSTRDWWQRSGNILPSLTGPNQRVRRVSDIPDADELDVAALFHRYLGLYTLARPSRARPNRGQLDGAIAQVLTEQAGTMHHMRSLHGRIRQHVEGLLQA